MSNLGYSDRPSKKDSLGMDVKYKGLAEFICTCQTPMTIAINGDWGTGKSSAMKIIQDNIIKKYDTDGDKSKSVENQIIEFNTWEFSLLGEGDNLLLNLLLSISDKLIELEKIYVSPGNANKGENNLDSGSWIKNRLNSLEHGRNFIERFIGKALFNVANEVTLNVPQAFVDTLNSFSSNKSNIESPIRMLKEIRDAISSLINSIIKGIKSNNNNNNNHKPERLFIFIDDLDRLEPSVALELIEGMQNYVSYDKCVFILALDQKVVERGLKSKYGSDFDKTMSDHFFDKVIQLPFKLPVAGYDITQYVKDLINGNINADNLDEMANNFADLLKQFEIDNPRTIKRSFNLWQMYQCIDSARKQEQENNVKSDPETSLKQYSILLLQFGKTSEEIHSKLSGCIGGSADCCNDKMCSKIEKKFHDLAKNYLKTYSESKNDPDLKAKYLFNCLDIIMQLFYGESYINDTEYDHSATREMIDILTFTQSQNSNHAENYSYAETAYKLLTLVESSEYINFDADTDKLYEEIKNTDDPAAALATMDRESFYAAYPYSDNGGKQKRAFKLTWNPKMDSSKLYFTLWSDRITDNLDLDTDNFCKSGIRCEDNSENKHLYSIGKASKSTYTCEYRMTVYVRNGDSEALEKIIREYVLFDPQNPPNANEH